MDYSNSLSNIQLAPSSMMRMIKSKGNSGGIEQVSRHKKRIYIKAHS